MTPGKDRGNFSFTLSPSFPNFSTKLRAATSNGSAPHRLLGPFSAIGVGLARR